jgi:hypothetical protein
MDGEGRATAVSQPNRLGPLSIARSAAVWGPGIVVMLADTDAGNVVTASQSGAQWGYRLLPLVLMLIPMLYMVQELTVRLGLYTGRGHGELIRERFGVGWAYVSTLGLSAAVIGSLITEFTGVAGIGELLGLSRSLTLQLAAATLLIIVASGSYKWSSASRSSSVFSSSRFSSSPGGLIPASPRSRETRSTCPSATATSCFWSRPSSARPSTPG